MQVKKSIKKVGAVAGSALMVGMTFGAAAPLADFPQPFVDDDGQVQSQIVVGSQGKVADVVGAINIGASVGQAAVQTTTQTVPGQSSVSVDGFSDETDIRGTLNAGSQVLLGSYDYSPLTFDTAYGPNDHLVEEEVRVHNDGNDVRTVTNGTDVLTEVDAGAVEYSVDYAPGFDIGEQVHILGNDYTITDMDHTASPQWVELGSTQTQQGLELGDTFSHGPYTVEVVDKDESAGSSGAIYVEVSKDGSVLKAVGLEEGAGPTYFDNEALKLEANDVFFGSKRDYIDVESTFTDTTIEDGQDSPFDADYTASLSFDSSTNNLTGVSLTNDLRAMENPDPEVDDQVQALSEGDTFAGPADYFTVSYAQLQDPDTEGLSFQEGTKARYTDGLGNTNTVNVSVLEGGSDVADGAVTGVDRKGNNYPVEVGHNATGAAPGDDVEVTLSYKDYERSTLLTIPEDGANNETLKVGPLTVKAEGADSADTDNTTFTPVVNVYNGGTTNTAASTLHTGFEGVLGAVDNTDALANATLTEDDAGDHIVRVEWTDSGAFQSARDTGAAVAGEDWAVSSADAEALTSFGSLVSVGPDGNQLSVSYPESQVQADLTVGASETSTSGGGTYQSVDAAAQGNLPSLAMLDSDVQESHKTNNHLILVGGPAVNTLVADLVEAGDVDLSDLEGQGSGALVQGVSDAFAEGQDALVVAGVNADDTRSASQYVANYASHESALSDAGDRLVLAEADYPSEQ